MYNSGFYKFAARTRLKGNFLAAFVGTLIYIIPTYLSTLIMQLLGSSANVLTVITEIIISVFVINIFNVGYMKFLLAIEPREEDATETKYDYNRVLWGFTDKFSRVLKITFLRDIKLLGWAVLSFLPLLVFTGVSAAVILLSEHGNEMYSYIMQLAMSPTPDMAEHVLGFLTENYRYLMSLLTVMSIATVALIIPYVYKHYEYAVIDMITADYPEMSSQEVFIRSKNIMDGFRGRFFMLELSFLLYQILLLFLMQAAGTIVYYIAMCAFLPYMQTTLLEFYRERKEVIEHNISVYGDN